MRTVTVLPHTADVRLHIQADSLHELFAGALIGMSNLLKDGFCDSVVQATINERISISATDRTSLLVDFLSEALTLSYTKKALFCTLGIAQLTDNQLEGELSGVPVDSFDEDIKAVTYHEANVMRNESGQWETVIFFDI